MKKSPNILELLVISDAQWVGGHEIMGLAAIEGLLSRGWKIHVVCSERNGRFARMIESLDSSAVTLERLPIRPSRLKSVFPFLFLPEFWLWWRALSRNERYRDVLLLQGRIEAAVLAAIVGKLRGRTLISYVPFAHSSTTVSGRAISGKFRDVVNRIYYRMIGAFITCYEGAKKDIQRWAPHAVVRVVHNPMPTKKDKACGFDFRAVHHISKSAFLVGMVGRIEFRQKGHDFILEKFKEVFAGVAEPHLCIVGEGPDRPRLEAMIRSLELDRHVTVLDWFEHVDDVLTSLDCLLLPSRFEGVPLVLLEAIALKTPVIATHVDGMVDYISKDWLFTPDDPSDCNQRLRALSIGSKQGYWDSNKQHLDVPASEASFRAAFASALFEFSSASPSSMEL